MTDGAGAVFWHDHAGAAAEAFRKQRASLSSRPVPCPLHQVFPDTLPAGTEQFDNGIQLEAVWLTIPAYPDEQPTALAPSVHGRW